MQENLASLILLLGEVQHLTVPDGKLHALIDLDVKRQFKWWHRLSSIYNLLEITECQSLFMLNLWLLVRETWPFHTILKLVILCAFLELLFEVFAMPTADVESRLCKMQLFAPAAALQLSFTASQQIHSVWCWCRMV